MGRKKLYSSEEERKEQYRRYAEKYRNKEGKREILYAANQKTQSDRHRRWREKYPEKIRLKSAMERATRLQRLPSWADVELIKNFYLNCPEGHHVDHIIPLRGKEVSGLHVIENLQYLPAAENMSKGNRYSV